MPWGANWGAAVWAAAWLALPGLAADVATPNGAFTFVTLDRHLTSWFSNAAPAEPWSRIPIGSNSSNLPFDIKGRIELTGMEAARLGAFAPTEARGISVAAKARRLLILHATENTAREGAPLASVVVHYANSETRTFRLAYGVHARNWTKEPSELTEALDDPDSAVIWTSTMPDNPSGPRRAGASDRRGRPLRLFCTAWVNPLPDVAIQSLDFLSLFSTASPFIVAVTLDHQPVDPATRVPSAMRRLVRKANEFKDGVYRGELVVKVRDAKGDAPVSNAIVNLTVVDDEVPFFFGEARADGDGRVVLAYPPQHLVSWVLQVRAPGFAPLFQRGSALDLDTGPAERIVRLDSGISVGGVIRNKQGAGIAGAKVALYEVFACGAKEYLRADHSVAVTDAQGRWRGRVRSSQVAGLHLEVTHPEFKPALTVVDATNAMVTAAGLLGGNAELVVEPALRMEWLVLDREGRPVPRADVYVQNPSDRAPLPPKLGQTDAQGRVVFATPEPMNVTVFVLASGFAPRSDSFQVEDGARREIRLSPRRPLRGRVVDRMAKPIAGVQVSVEDWQGTELLSYAGQTDSEGRFEWADAPEDNVSIEFSKAGFTSTSYSTSAQAGERRFTLQRMLGVSGLVLDAETRQPIENFIVTRGRAYNPAEPMRWDRYESQRGRNGQYTIRSYDYGPSSRFCVKVEAPGYLPAVSPIYTGADF
ncbi:MAG TPA: carboxypeptidase-like regulatory domain-containing protein, partial [Methylomirabilota bacterium]|nr:carboxypeptidase-like regulatory domain-containing protein [Methylomirabilota bacterium]